MKKRIIYGVITVVLIAVEVLIALYVHDKFVRPYLGDVIVVVVIYTLVRTIIPDRCRLLPLLVFIFATGVELLQIVNLPKVFGFEDSRLLSTLVGSVFDVKDIICYAVGCALLGALELYICLRQRRTGCS